MLHGYLLHEAHLPRQHFEPGVLPYFTALEMENAAYSVFKAFATVDTRAQPMFSCYVTATFNSLIIKIAAFLLG